MAGSTQEFRRFLVNIAQQLSEQESHQLAYINELPEQYHHLQALPVLQRLEVAGIFSSAKPEKLVEILKDINRIDLSKKAKEFIAKRSKRARKKDADVANENADNELSLRANFEVALIQTKITLEQLERVQQDVSEMQQMRVHEVVTEARELADGMHRKLQYASKMSQETFARQVEEENASRSPATPTDVGRRPEECSGFHAGSSAGGDGGGKARPMPPPKPQRPQSGITANNITRDSEVDDDIYEKPIQGGSIPAPTTTKGSDHYYSIADHEKSSPQAPPVAHKPQKAEDVRRSRANTFQGPVLPPTTQTVTGRIFSTTSKQESAPPPVPQHRNRSPGVPQSKVQATESERSHVPDSHRQHSSPSNVRSGIPKPNPKPRRRSTVSSRDSTSTVQLGEDSESSDYSGGTGTGDSGFSDARAFLKQLPPQSRRSLPRTRQQGGSSSTYYKSLQRPEGAPSYYKTLNMDRIPEATYIDRMQQEPENAEPVYQNWSEARNATRNRQ